MSKEHGGRCSWGAKREGKGETGLGRQPGTSGEVGVLMQHVESEELEDISGAIT